MVTESIIIDRAEGWRSLTMTGTVIHIASVIDNRVRVRLGISSTSEGFILNVGDTMSANETIYVKALFSSNSSPAILCVVKD